LWGRTQGQTLSEMILMLKLVIVEGESDRVREVEQVKKRSGWFNRILDPSSRGLSRLSIRMPLKVHPRQAQTRSELSAGDLLNAEALLFPPFRLIMIYALPCSHVCSQFCFPRPLALFLGTWACYFVPLNSGRKLVETSRLLMLTEVFLLSSFAPWPSHTVGHGA
jgi:hypothetical protein